MWRFRHKTKPLLLLFLLIVALFPVILMPFTPLVSATPEWPEELSDWNYRKSHTIFNATDAGENYTVKMITLYNSTPTESYESETLSFEARGNVWSSNGTGIFRRWNGISADSDLWWTIDGGETFSLRWDIPDGGRLERVFMLRGETYKDRLILNTRQHTAGDEDRLWYSDDLGATINRITDSLAGDKEYWNFDEDITNEVLYAGRYEIPQLTPTIEIYKSEDGGITWSNISKSDWNTNYSGMNHIHNVRYDPSTGWLYASANNWPLWRSKLKDGSDWVLKIDVSPCDEAIGIVFKEGWVYISTDQADGKVWRFQDDGTDNVQIPTEVLDSIDVNSYYMEMDQSGRIWVSFQDDGEAGPAKLFTSEDGTTWTERESVVSQDSAVQCFFGSRIFKNSYEWYGSDKGSYIGRHSYFETNQVNLEAHAQNDFGDVRFYNTTHALNYWMEEKYDGENATFWVQISNDLSSEDQIVYVYYGATGKTTTSDGSFFEFFDDFSGDLSQWTQRSGTWTISAGTLKSAETTGAQIASTASSFGDVALRCKWKRETTIIYSRNELGFLARSTDSNNFYMSQVVQASPTSQYQLRKCTASSWDTWNLNISLTHDENWATQDFYLYNDSLKARYNSSSYVEQTDSDHSSGSIGYRLGTYESGKYFYIDWVFVRKYVDPEPVHAGFGEEEQQPPQDTQAPTYSDTGHNSTLVSDPCMFYSKWTDETGLSGYIFGTNNTGSWVNETWASLSGNPAWANVTKTLSSSIGVRVEYQFWCNDTSNNWNNTGILFLITTDEDAPTYSDVGKNSTQAETLCLFYTQWSNLELSGFIFSWNGTGSWTNDTWSDPWGGTPTTGWSNVTKTLPSVDTYVGWRIYCNDTSDNWGDTTTQSFITTAGPDEEAPQYSNVAHNTTLISTPCLFSSDWTDNIELSGFIFGTNNTGSWVNETWVSLSGASDTAQVVKTLTSSVGARVEYRFWANDTSDNWNDTDICFLTTTEEEGDSTAPTYSQISHSTTEAGLSCLFKTYWQDETGLSGYIFGTNNTGSWVNDTWASLSGNPAWSELTKILTTTIGIQVQYRFWANDTSNNWNDTDIQVLTITDTTLPTYSNIAHNTTLANTTCLFSCDWADNVQLSGFIFGTDNTGSWVNDTWQALSGVSDTAEAIKTLVATIGTMIQYRFYTNDSNGNWEASSLELFYTTGTGESQERKAGGVEPRKTKPWIVLPFNMPDPKILVLPVFILLVLLVWASMGRKKKYRL